MYERNLLNNSVFKDDVFQGTTIKKIKDFTNNKFAKHFNVYFTGIEDAIEKGYVCFSANKTFLNVYRNIFFS